MTSSVTPQTAAIKYQLEESKKLNPRIVLEHHTIRGMIQEADNMHKGLRTGLGLMSMAQGNDPEPQPPSMGPTSSFAQPAPPVTPPVTVSGSHLLPTTFFQAQVPGGSMTPTPPPVPTVSTSTPQASTSVIATPSLQTAESPRAKPTAKTYGPSSSQAIDKC